MEFVKRGHPGLAEQMSRVCEALPTRGPVAAKNIRVLLEDFDENPNELSPMPKAQEVWLLEHLFESPDGSLLNGSLSIYVYEEWGVRFALARCVRANNIVAALLLVEPAKDRTILARHLCLSLLDAAKEVLWPM